MHHGELLRAEIEHAANAQRAAPGLTTLGIPALRFRFLFPGLTPYSAKDEPLRELAETMREKGDAAKDAHPSMRAGHAFLGQFLDHDITFDALSRLGRSVSDRNFRSPALDLDSVYGGGPDAARHLFDVTDPLSLGGRLPVRLLLPPHRRWDLPRNTQGTALIGDPRNDENHFISQLHRRMIGFHNYVVEQIANEHPNDPKTLFEEARKLTTQHYHAVIRDDFLPKIIEPDILKEILNAPRFYRPAGPDDAYIPIEFAVAAYRFGHTLIRESYRLTKKRAAKLFDLPPFEQRTSLDALDWSYFVGDGPGAQPARKIDALVSSQLFDLPFIADVDGPKSLPERNMRRGRDVGLPSGQKVAEALGVTPLTNAQLGVDKIEGLGGEAPLWYYVLRESALTPGDTLGPVGSRIVGEVLVGLMKVVPHSPLNDATWKPRFGRGGKFDLETLVTLGA